MLQWDAEVAVIGLGAWGSCALWRLAGVGVDVIGFERYRLGHALGSSHGGSRMFRITCLEHSGLVPMARRSLELWRELETLAGQQLLHQVGGLLVGPSDGHIVGGTLRAARKHGIAVELLSAVELHARFPQHAGVPAGHIGVWEPSAGIIRPEASVRAAAGLAVAAGARIYVDTKVTDITFIDGGAIVHTAAKDFRVRQVVVTVGSWTSTLVAGLPLETLRMPITWFRPIADREPFALQRFPVFMRELGNGLIVWGNGWESDHEVKLGLEDDGDNLLPIDPETDDRAVSPHDWSGLTAQLDTTIPGLEPVPAKIAVCMMTRTPDGQFVLGRPDGDDRLVVAGGCNAHGFKHATGIGEALAQLVLGEKAFCDLAFTDPDRFNP